MPRTLVGGGGGGGLTPLQRSSRCILQPQPTGQSSFEWHEDEEVVLEDIAPHPFSQKELNDLVRDLSLSKDSAELLASRLKEKTPFWQCSHQASRVPPFFSLQWRTWCTVQILRSFCSSLEYHSTNPNIGYCLLTAASDHWNVFCYTTATSLPLYPSLTRLHWRRSMKRWRMCWRKLVMISISSLFVLTWRWWTFCLDNSLASPSTHVFCACGIVGTVLSITRKRTGLCRKNWCLAKKGTSSTTLWWTETEYSSQRCTSSSA